MKAKNLLFSTFKHELISGSFFVFLGFIISSFLSFIFNLFLARNLSYSNYGEYATLLSVFTLLTIPAASLSAVVVRFAVHYFATGQVSHGAYLYKKMFFFWGGVALIIFLTFFPLSIPLSKFLKIYDLRLIILMGAGVAFSYFAIVNSAFLQSLTKFATLSFLSIFGALGKLFFGFVLVMSGLKVLGAMIALTLLTVINFAVAVFPLRSLAFYKHDQPVQLNTREIINYGVPASLALLFLSSFISTDVILVKHFFSVAEAGYYGGLSLIGKVIFYFTGPIPMVMFPLLVKRHSKGEAYKNLLYISLLLVLFPSLLITIFYFLFPDFTIRIFLGGGEYERVGQYLGLFGVFLTVFSLVNILVNFFLSVKKIGVLYIVAFGAILQVFLIFIFHSNFQQIIASSIASCSLLLVILLLYYIKEYGLNNS